MAYAAQNYGYNTTPTQSVEKVNFAAIAGFQDAAKSLQIGLVSKTTNSSSATSSNVFSATNAGTRTESSGFGREFDFDKFGKMKDAESYASDADKEKAVDEKKPNMAMGVDLDKLGALKEYGPEAIALAGRSINNYSVEEMKENFNKTGFLTPEAAEPQNIAQQQAQEYARDFQKSMSMDKKPLDAPENGFVATARGINATFEKSAGAMQMLVA